MPSEEDVQRVISTIFEYGWVPENETKQWVLSEALRLLLGDDLQEALDRYEKEHGSPWKPGKHPLDVKEERKRESDVGSDYYFKRPYPY